MPPSATDPDRLALLEDERRFLLTSLADLEREHDAGDLDEVDYQALKDGYTQRAAAVLRAIDEGRRAQPPRPPRRWSRTLLLAGGVAVIAIGLGVAVARFAGQRLPGQTVSGGIAEDSNSRLTEARALLGTDPAAAFERYREVMETDPDNAEATTYVGWLAAIQLADSGSQEDVRRAAAVLDQAIALDPDRADAYCFKAVVQFRFLGDAVAARPALDQCVALDPPAEVAGQVQGLADDIDAALASDATATSTATSTAP
jgi:tetratricopeptide (TPR) repeat protein